MPPTPTFTHRIPRKRFHSTMITSPDGKGVIMGGGFILDGWSKVYLTSLIELRLNGTSNEFYWTNINQTMKIPREGPVIFTVPDDYCIRPDILSLIFVGREWISFLLTCIELRCINTQNIIRYEFLPINRIGKTRHGKSINYIQNIFSAISRFLFTTFLQKIC